MNPTILAIESSCDETSASVIQNGRVLSNIVATQAIHEQYGGVVPELASRAHQQNIIPVVSQALQRANIAKSQLDAVAFTRGPGLLGALLVGCSFAKSFALGLNLPLIEVNHMQAHILAHFIDAPQPNFPFLCLTVSGGHTQIVLVRSHLDMEVLGQTTDDAVGEAFDKSAKLLGLPYPGGPMLDKIAATGNPNRFSFPIVNMEGYDFSFSGIKTSILNFVKKNTAAEPDFVQHNLPDICASIQWALIQTLLKKLVLAAKEQNIKEIAIAGGVSANSGLRATLQEYAQKHNWNVYLPAFEYCTDNAAMIAMAAHYQYLAGDFTTQYASPDPRLKV
ncbi:tRNA (adenosine(37)-N6)-threonylcarbamoyltransferase complex transferase subunit TsaD [Rufibacter sp. XAAS-G3-1]|uniref:tRNA (adenosine(37)-N6)-threonylcarbamoyltransferase complex transferase subunit TsaD n=1 Tax=Rufibacter sp. XAAS-G3-1 TaxID=2729134 RepID=UPI0015E662EA|nr:tRNA (adenosine(37)-N6)-threonylcarbamoyltransferase complex transferase subunit TsaD [Rufibacter sp. XAAS-G3-1]